MNYREVNEEKIKSAITASRGNLRTFSDLLGMSMHQAFRELQASQLEHLLYEQRDYRKETHPDFKESEC